LLVAPRAVAGAGIEEGAGEVAQPGHAGRPRAAVDVDVEHRQEDADAERPASGEIRVLDLTDVRHRAVCRADEKVKIARRRPIGVPEKRQDEEPQHQDRS